MKDFRIAKSHIVLQGILLLLLIFYTFRPENFTDPLRLPILLIIDFTLGALFVSAIFRRITVENGVLTLKTILKTTSVNLKELAFAQAVPALARWVVLLNDNKSTVILSSMVANFDELVSQYIVPNLPDEDKKKFDIITKADVASKERVQIIFMVVICFVVLYGILKTFYPDINLPIN